MARKSPYRHPVRSYVREGVRVDKYIRGEGKAPRAEAKPIGSSVAGGARWRVSRGGESVTVKAASIVDALRRGVDTLRATENTVTVNRI